MSTFGEAISFIPSKKTHKKPKSSKLVKHNKGKVSKLGRNGKGIKGKGRKTTKFQKLDPEPAAAALGTSKNKKKEEAVDQEQQFILRMPPGPAVALRRDVESGATNLKDKLGIEFEQDMRRSRVTYGGQVLNAKLVDLPTIVQCMKTTDMKTFYSTADISQMLVCVSDDEESKEDVSAKKKDKDHKWKWNHGIAQPLKNVRKKRFRKTMKKKTNDQPDIEKEVRRLFRMDCEAIDIKWEVVVEDPSSNNTDAAEKQVLAQGGTAPLDGDDDDDDDGKDMDARFMNLGEEDIFGEVSSSDDDDDDEKDVNVMDSDDGGADIQSAAGDYSNMGGNDSTNMSDGGDVSVNLNAKLQELERTISDMHMKKCDLEKQIEETDNYLMKDRLQGELEQIELEKTRKEQEFNIVSSMFNQ